jgi:hypothetical protein
MTMTDYHHQDRVQGSGSVRISRCMNASPVLTGPPLSSFCACLSSLPAAVYFAVIKTWEGHPELIMATLTSKFGPTLAANYVIWPIAHLINFRFVPSE